MNKLYSKIKIKDIAEMAGVSAGTVDRVLHDRGDVSKKSREKVEKVLKKINYVPNIYASALASKKDFRFVAVIPKHNPEDYWEMIQNGILRAAEELSDFRVNVEIHAYDIFNIASFCKVMEDMIGSHPDGVLLAPSLKSVTFSYTCKMDELKIPYVFVDSRIEEAHPLAYFGQNSHLSGCLAGKLLLTLNPDIQEIAVFSFYNVGQIPANQISQRMAGFSSFMLEKKESCRLHRITLELGNQEKNEVAMSEIFLKNKSVEGAVIFSSRAYVVAEFLEKYNLKKQISFIGYDLLERNVKCMKNDSIDYLIAQRPDVQGNRGIKALSDHLIFKKPVNVLNYVPMDILIHKNIDFYLDFPNC